MDKAQKDESTYNCSATSQVKTDMMTLNRYAKDRSNWQKRLP